LRESFIARGKPNFFNKERMPEEKRRKLGGENQKRDELERQKKGQGARANRSFPATAAKKAVTSVSMA